MIREKTIMKEEDNNKMKRQPEGTILLAYIKETATIDEKEIVERWLKKDVSHEVELLQLARIYYAQYTANRILSRDPETAYLKIQSHIKEKKRRIWLKQATTVAACIIGVLILSNVVIYMREQSHNAPFQTVTIQANAGMRTQFNLPDGTWVYLGSGSTLSYPIPFDTNKRLIMLNGEAYFKVTHNPEQPFIVGDLNKGMSVKVLGTEFNMEAYEDDDIISATLVKGKISVLLDVGNGLIMEEILKPSEKAIYNKTEKKFAIKSVDTAHDTAWMNGSTIFKDTPLPEVLRKLSHLYNVEFTIKDKIIETYLFTGVFENQQLSQILNYLEISSGIEYKIVKNNKGNNENFGREEIILQKKEKPSI